METRNSILELPVEVTLEILSFTSADSLYNVCLVTRWLRSIAQPVLFRHYVQPSSPGKRSIKPILRVLLDRPDLAACIKQMTIHAYEAEPEDGWLPWTEWLVSKDDRLKRKDCEDSLLADRYTNDFFGNSKDLVLLLSMTQNVETIMLDLHEYHEELGLVVQYARSNWESKHAFLPKLKSIQFDSADTPLGFSLRDVEPLLSLSSLRQFRGHMCGTGAGDEAYHTIQPKSLKLQHIDLLCSVMSTKAIVNLVEGCAALRRFQLVYGDPDIGNWLSSAIELDAILDAFAVHTEHLEVLALRFEQDEVLEQIGEPKPLASYRRLRHIDLPQQALVRPETNDGTLLVDELPSSIETLVIRRCSLDIIPHLWSIANHNGSLPRLSRIAIDCMGGLPEMVRLEFSLRSRGIELNVPEYVPHWYLISELTSTGS